MPGDLNNFSTQTYTFAWFYRVNQSRFGTNPSRGSRVMIGHTNRDYYFIIEMNEPWFKNLKLRELTLTEEVELPS